MKILITFMIIAAGLTGICLAQSTTGPGASVGSSSSDVNATNSTTNGAY